jgi:mRNA-degrading endonuclease RelE of RelBE toxin-antitoxin system
MLFAAWDRPTFLWMTPNLLTNGLNSGYNMARMKYEILFAPEAVQDFKRLSARDRSIVKEAIEKHLRHEPQRISKSRIKKLRGMSRSQYRLRVGEIRVFYDIVEQRVEVLAIVPKSKAATWLEELREEK